MKAVKLTIVEIIAMYHVTYVEDSSLTEDYYFT